MSSVDPTQGETEFQTAMRQANEAWTAESENFEKGRDDQRFYAGEQWDPIARQAREDANRPAMTINRLTAFVRQVTGDVRKDTPSIKVAPSKDGASEQVAEVYNGLIRHIEQKSNAKAAYVQATENACVTGLGSFRVKAAYSSPGSFEQELLIERLPDPFAVLYDPSAREPDKSDGRYAFVFTQIPKEQFAKDFPDATPSSMPTGPNAMTGMSWFTPNTVSVAEYWYRKPVKKTLYQLEDGSIVEEKPEEGGPQVVNSREVTADDICMRLMSGVEFLTEENPSPFDWIPICPVIGEELFIDGRILRRGLVRDAKDAQRVYNYMRTAAVEATALQPKAPWMVTVDMVAGLESHWDNLGSGNPPYVLYRVDKAAPTQRPERAQPAVAQTGLDSQAAIASDDIKAVTGIYDASLGAKSNETSGRAIMARQKEGDTGTFHFIDNLGTAQRHLGRILVKAIPKIYDTPRIVRVLGEDGTGEMQPINHPVGPGGQLIDPATLAPEELQAIQKINDLSVGEYDVTVITGPGFATRRQEARESIIELARAVPQVLADGMDILIRNLDFPGADEIAKRIEEKMKQGPDPLKVAETNKALAEAQLTTAQAEKTEVEAVGEGVTVMQMMAQLGTTLQQIQQQLAAGLPGAPPQAAPPPPGAVIKPPDEGGAPPAAPPPMAPANASGMGELEPMPAAAG